MARRRGSVRVVTSPGGSQFYDPNGSLPRSSYRVGEDDPLYGHPLEAVYLERGQRGRSHPISSPTFISYGRPPAKQVFGRAVRKSVGFRSILVSMPSRVRFCIMRKQRREVLFAYRRAGYGGSAPKARYRRNVFSSYRC